MTMLDTTAMMSINKYRQRQQYRTQLGIVIDILKICISTGIEGAIITKISRGANLSHYATTDNCKKLIDAGLINLIKTDKNAIYKITGKGINFFYEFQKFQDLIKELNVRL